jgi:hypothetical protein
MQVTSWPAQAITPRSGQVGNVGAVVSIKCYAADCGDDGDLAERSPPTDRTKAGD